MICLTAAARRTIEREARRSADGRETGGILLGHDADDGEPLRVTVAGEPGPAARRSALRFLRDLEHAKCLADEAYDRDASVWVGEWHTHPTGPSRPSRRDLRTYQRLLTDAELDFDQFAAFIVVADGVWDRPRLIGWIVRLSAESPRQLVVTTVEISPDGAVAEGDYE
jgi:integrative and conjugative element protein (TIGR02256 family)